MRFTSPLHLTSLLALTLAATACGDDSETGSGGSSGSTTATTSTTGATTTGSTTSTTTGSTGAGGEGQGGAGGASACGPIDLPAMDDDTSVRGVFTVGARTVDVDGLTAEVWYPAADVQGDQGPKTYDIRDHLPASEVDKIADADAPVQTCDCFEGIPVAEGGPFPVVVFVHGTAGFRSQSLEILTHWASRGFVVVAADHPGLQLHDLLELACGQGNTPRDLDGDIAKLVEAVGAPSGDLAFLDGHVDASQLAMSGHSAGGAAIEGQGDVARVLIPMAAGGVTEGAALASTLILGAQEDQVVPFDAQLEGFDTSPAPKRLVGLSPAGHLIFSSLCSIRNDAGQNIVDVGVDAGVCGLSLADGLFDCSDAYMSDETGWTIIRDASTAALEETLLCLPERGAWLADIQSRYPEVAAFDESL